jgi:hypothetical protein
MFSWKLYPLETILCCELFAIAQAALMIRDGTANGRGAVIYTDFIKFELVNILPTNITFTISV